ncbi:MAG: TlpA family protein disulfide reductase [Bacteroidetes bacterium]|nr:TlpA family protein disulfide reductase [Bacteroidota bacterium]
MNTKPQTLALLSIALLLIVCLAVPTQAQQPRTLSVGDTAKGIFIGAWLDNAPASGEAFNGRPVVLEFWSTWCKPCIAAFPHLNALADTFSHAVQFISISQETRRTVEPFLEKHEMRTAVAVDTEQGTTHKVFGVWVLPRTFLLSPEGVVLWTGHPTKLTGEMLRKLAAE